MSNKQKNKSTENRQGQNQSARQEIPDYGTKSQNKNPEMENKGNAAVSLLSAFWGKGPTAPHWKGAACPRQPPFGTPAIWMSAGCFGAAP